MEGDEGGLRNRERAVGLIEFLLLIFIAANAAISALAFWLVAARR